MVRPVGYGASRHRFESPRFKRGRLQNEANNVPNRWMSSRGEISLKQYFFRRNRYSEARLSVRKQPKNRAQYPDLSLFRTLSPIRRESPLQRFLQKTGSGLHLALRSDRQ